MVKSAEGRGCDAISLRLAVKYQIKETEMWNVGLKK
jgi:hypothetical protein